MKPLKQLRTHLASIEQIDRAAFQLSSVLLAMEDTDPSAWPPKLEVSNLLQEARFCSQAEIVELAKELELLDERDIGAADRYYVVSALVAPSTSTCYYLAEHIVKRTTARWRNLHQRTA